MDTNKLLDLPGVVAVDISHEILVTATKKVDLPTTIDGLPVRVEYVETPPKFEYTATRRPLRPGVRIHGGSAGFYVKHRGKNYLITCAHICGSPEAWLDNQVPEDMTWYQPNRNVHLPRAIGRFCRWIHPMHGMDGMAIELYPWIGTSHELLDRPLRGQKIVEPRVGMKVLRMGWRTGLSEGEITHVGGSVSVRTHDGRFYRVHRTFRTTTTADGGDSGGTFVCAETGDIVGILVAGFFGSSPQWGQGAKDICDWLEIGTELVDTPGQQVIELWIGDKTISVNGEAKQMDVEPHLKNSRTFIPLRFVAENMGYSVDWDGGERKVTLTQK